LIREQDLSFAAGVKAMLLHDADYLMLGEIRDALSAQAAVHAAMSGRILLSTNPLSRRCERRDRVAQLGFERPGDRRSSDRRGNLANL